MLEDFLSKMNSAEINRKAKSFWTIRHHVEHSRYLYGMPFPPNIKFRGARRPARLKLPSDKT
jgi:hypothetical protein